MVKFLCVVILMYLLNANFADLLWVFIFTDRNTKTKLQGKRQVSDGFRDRNSKSPNGKRELTR